MSDKQLRIAIGISEETVQNEQMMAIIERLRDRYELVLVCDRKLKQQRKYEQQLQLNIINDETVVEAIEKEFPTDLFLFLPLSSDYLGKLANGLIDTVVLKMGSQILAKNRPMVLAIATRDALSLNGNNLMKLMVTKGVYFVPFYQNDPINTPNGLIADFDRVDDAIRFALKGKQIQPIILARDKGD